MDGGEVCCFGVRLRNLRDLRETLGFRLVQYNLSTLACYFPADCADHAEEYSKLYYFAEKDRLFEVKAVLSFWGLSAIICEICGRLWGLFGD